MRRLTILMLVLLLAAACMPTLEVDDKITPVPADKWLNENPDLALGGCNDVVFYTEKYGEEHITQCTPAGYDLYQDVVGNPVAINYTGLVYSILPHGTKGSIGFTLPDMTLTPGQYIIHVIGEWDGDGNVVDYAIRAHYSIDGVPGMVDIGGHELFAKGDYMATFTLDAPALGSYQVSVYLFMVFPPTADSFLTIKSITVEDAR